jgi:hypothetical protein
MLWDAKKIRTEISLSMKELTVHNLLCESMQPSTDEIQEMSSLSKTIGTWGSMYSIIDGSGNFARNKMNWRGFFPSFHGEVL